mgnify:CR=1 FL=1
MRASSVELYILNILIENHVHLTAHEFFERVRVSLPAVNPSTVYRALERMGKNGLVSVSDMGTGAAVYEVVDGNMHHHLVCQHCGKVLTIDHHDVENFFASIGEVNHFQVQTNHLVLFGLCADCQKLIAESGGEKYQN